MIAGNAPKTQNRNSAKFIVRLLVSLAWGIIILWLSLTPSLPQIPGILGWDKLLHAGAYGLLSLTIAQFLIYLPVNPSKVWWQAGLVAVSYGAMVEIMQFLIQTGRTAESWDLFADAVGVFICCVIFRQVTGTRCQRHEQPDKEHG